MFKYMSVLITVLFVMLTSCTDPNQTDGACNNGYFHETYSKYDLADRKYLTELKYPYYDSVIYYKVVEGKARFYAAKSKFNVCPKEHVKIYFEITFKDVQQSLPFSVKGESYWSLFGDDYVIFSGTPDPGQKINSKLYEIGLKQAFGENEADFDILLYLEFADQGDYSKNLAYFAEHVNSFHVVISGSNFVAPAK